MTCLASDWQSLPDLFTQMLEDSIWKDNDRPWPYGGWEWYMQPSFK